MNLSVLREIGEWAALGFYQSLADHDPWPVYYGKAYRALYENMSVRVDDTHLIIPFEPFDNSITRESNNVWTAAGYIVDLNHNAGLRINPHYIDKKKELFPQHAEFIDQLVEDLSKRLDYFGGYTHTNPDIRRVVNEGVLAMEAELDKELAAVKSEGENADPTEKNTLWMIKEYVDGVKAFYQTTLKSLRKATDEATGERKRKLAIIAEAFGGCFMKPSSTFLEGFLAVNMTWMLDGCDSIGRVDQALGPLFEADLERKRVDVEFVRELLDEWWNSFEVLNGWNIQLGGRALDGKDGCNELTKEMLLACERNKVRRPNVAFRITKDTPDEFVVLALRALRNGSGRPALYNDDKYIETLMGMDLGLTPEDGREIGFGGCTETMIAGLSNCGSLEGGLNFAEILELTLHDGLKPHTGQVLGPRTGKLADFADFDSFFDAFKRQVQYATDSFASASKIALTKRFTAGDPKPYRTFFTRDCVKNRKSFEAGGARYNWAVVSYQGIANMIDSLAAIKKLVFEEKKIGKDDLLTALKEDFEGSEQIRRLLVDAPKYGNDESYVDEIGKEILEYAWKELYRHETPRGGRYLASCILFTTYLHAGRQVGALPDGRKAFTALTDSVGASQGNDVNGPTALLNSVTKMPLEWAIGTPVLNLRFSHKVMSDENLPKVASLVRTFFAKGGLQLQVSVLDSKTMREAQKNPDDYRDLIVRIGGFSEYFNILDKELQESVIKRVEHDV